MQVLKLVHRLEFRNVEAIRKDPIGFAFEQMLALVCGDMGHRCKNIRTMCCRSFDTVSMVDTSFAGFMVYIKVLEVVVKINTTRTEISAKERRMRGEDGSYVDMSFPA